MTETVSGVPPLRLDRAVEQPFNNKVINTITIPIFIVSGLNESGREPAGAKPNLPAFSQNLGSEDLERKRPVPRYFQWNGSSLINTQLQLGARPVERKETVSTVSFVPIHCFLSLHSYFRVWLHLICPKLGQGSLNSWVSGTVATRHEGETVETVSSRSAGRAPN